VGPGKGRGRCRAGRIGGCEGGHRSGVSTPAIMLASDAEGIMRKIVLLITATALFLCSVDVWAGSSRTSADQDAPVFIISNAL
jgi:hypothetical protein